MTAREALRRLLGAADRDTGSVRNQLERMNRAARGCRDRDAELLYRWARMRPTMEAP